MVKILAALSILNSSGVSPGVTKKVAALLVAALVTVLPKGCKQVRYLEWIHIINGAKAPNRRMAECACFIHHDRQQPTGWLFELSGI